MTNPVEETPSWWDKLKKAKFYGHSTSSQELKLNKPEYRLVYPLYDEESGRVGTAIQHLSPPAVETLRSGVLANAVFGRLRETKNPGASFKVSP